jgi:CubicO group peptidase (beta-lactamase class C family)
MSRLTFAIIAGLGVMAAASLPLAQPSSAPASAAPAAAPAAPNAHPLTKEDVDAWLDGVLPSAIRSGEVPGAVVVVVKDGQILTERGYGYADLATKAPVDPKTTMFRPGSITKTFTWTAVMQLVEQGKLDLDTDVNKYLDFKIPPYHDQPITLRNIMTHTAGFEEKFKNLMSDKPDVTLEQYIKGWTPKRVFAPGKVPAYSNYAASLAGYIVQRVSRESWADYVTHHILQPLDMTHSSVQHPFPDSVKPFLAKGYRTGSKTPNYIEYIPPAPAGDLAASGEDMGHFMIAQLQNGAYGAVTILKPQTAIALHTTQPKIYPALNGMALGFVEESRNGHRVIWHNGGTQVFLSDMHLYLDDHVGVFVSQNGPGKPGAVSQIHDALYAGFTDRYFPRTTPLPAPTVDKATALAHARLMAGPWDNSRRSFSSFASIAELFGPMTLKANPDGTIAFAGPGGGASSSWREVQPFVWRNVDDPENAIQAIVKDGKPVMFGISMAAPAAFLRIPAWRSPVWMTPALFASLAILLLTGLLWPILAFTRKTYGAAFALGGRDALVYRATRAFALAAVAVFGGYVLFLQWLLGDLARASAKSDGLVLTLGVAALVAFVGAAVFAIWDLLRVWRGGSTWRDKLGAVLVAASALMLLWTGFLFHLMGFNTQY